MSQQTERCGTVEERRWHDAELLLDTLQFNPEMRSLKFTVHRVDVENGYTVKESFLVKEEIVPSSNIEVHISNVDEMKSMFDLHEYSAASILHENLSQDSYEIETILGLIRAQGSGIEINIVSKTKAAETYIRVSSFFGWIETIYPR